MGPTRAALPHLLQPAPSCGERKVQLHRAAGVTVMPRETVLVARCLL
jgi:hypothetical protein